MKNLIRLMSALVVGLLFALNVSSVDAAERDGTAIFKRYLDTPSNFENVSCRIQGIIHNPYLHGSLNYRGAMLKDEAYMRAMIDLMFFGGGKAESASIPIFFDAKKDKTTVYMKIDGEWVKREVSYKGLTEDESKSDDDDFDLLSICKSVRLIDENASQNVLRVTLDTELAAQAIEAENKPVEKSGETQAVESEGPIIISEPGNETEDIGFALISGFASKTLRSIDGITFDLTINKNTNQLQMIEADFSNVFNAIARSLITEVPTGDDDFLNALGKESTMRLYVVFDEDTKINVKDYELPREIRKAKKVKTFSTTEKRFAQN